MPNPYINNAQAAGYIEYYASREMQKSSVDRLYYGSVQHKQETLKKVEEEVYSQPPPPVRSQAQIREHVAKMTQEEQRKRMQNKAKIENEVYGPARFGPNRIQHLDPSAETDLVKRCYYDQKKRFDRKRDEMEKKKQAFRQVDANLQKTMQLEKQREKNFKLVMHSPPRQDNKELLCYEGRIESEYLKKDGSGSENNSSQRRSGSRSAAERKDYFSRLSKPLRVTPKKPVERGVNNFQLYLKYH